MNLQEQLQAALADLRLAGYTVREEWLGGGGGLCVLKGQKIFFCDISLDLPERVEQARDAVAEVRKKSSESSKI